MRLISDLENIIIKKGKRKNHHLKVGSFFKFIFRLLLRIILTVILLSIITGSYCLYKILPIVQKIFEDAEHTVLESNFKTFRERETGYIYDDDLNILASLKTEHDTCYVEYEELPENLINACVAIEDKRFFQHHGVDWASTGKAAYLLFTTDSVTRGGSTITQQLARNVFLNFEVSLDRKFKEIAMAIALEHKYSKKQILEFYVNNINYSNGYYGIGAAAKGYFGKELKDLDLAQLALLCAIPNNPTIYNPRKNLDNVVFRRNLILSEMNKQGYITESVYLKTSNSPVHLVKRKQGNFYNYESSYAIDCATRTLMKESGFQFRYTFDTMEDYSSYRKEYQVRYEEVKNQLYSRGYRIYTSINRNAQNTLQESIDTVLKFSKEKNRNGIYQLQGASTAIDNHSGKVIAIVGGRKQDTNGVMTLNRAYQSFLQPGSTIKPLAVYTPALEKGYTDKTIVDDSYFVGGPSNSDDSYSGNITLREAICRSKNVIAWKVMRDIGVKTSLKYLQRMKFSKIVPNDFYLSASLGGLYYGVNTVEMANGYFTLANDGKYQEITCLDKITTSNDEVIYKSSQSEVRIYTKEASRMITNILEDVGKTGTARGLSLVKNMPFACKTGTTNGQKAGWFCGYTPYYTVSVYVGRDDGKGLDSLWGSTYPKEIWKKIQDGLNKNKRKKSFKEVEISKKRNENKRKDSTPSSTPSIDEFVKPSATPYTIKNPKSQKDNTASSNSSNPSVSQTPEPTRTPIPTPIPTPKSTPKPTEEPTPQMTSMPIEQPASTPEFNNSEHTNTEPTPEPTDLESGQEVSEDD